MKLYQDSRAPNPRRVRIFLHEKGLLDQVERVEVSINSRANEAREHRARNPLGLVPVLELSDGRMLRESIAICRWIEEGSAPEPNLFGVDPWERAVVEMWNRHAEMEVLFTVAQIFRNTHEFWKDRLEQAPEFGVIMRARLAERMGWLDGELATRPYLAGERFTVADITLLCALDFAKVVKIRIDPDAHPHLARWHALVASRPSYQA
jgi:glutathione S-transferase